MLPFLMEARWISGAVWEDCAKTLKRCKAGPQDNTAAGPLLPAASAFAKRSRFSRHRDWGSPAPLFY